MSLTDADARLMNSWNGFVAVYNLHTDVNSNTHLIPDSQIMNLVTDHGPLDSTL